MSQSCTLSREKCQQSIAHVRNKPANENQERTEYHISENLHYVFVSKQKHRNIDNDRIEFKIDYFWNLLDKRGIFPSIAWVTSK